MTQPRLNPAKLAELRELGGGNELVAELAGLFAQAAPARVAALREAAAARDAARLGREAHSLKSSAGSLGADALAGICAEIERLGRDAFAPGHAELVERACAEIEAVVPLLETEARGG